MFKIMKMKRFFSRAALLVATLVLVFTSCTAEKIAQLDPPKYFVEKTHESQISTSMMTDWMPALKAMFFLIRFPAKKLAVDAITYNTVDPFGFPVVASGTITYPLDTDIRGVILSQHFTITSNNEAPSVSMITAESLLGFTAYALVQTDYIGYGATKDMPHPYLHAQSSAQQGVDMLLAAREYMSSIGKDINKPTYAVGYSQGAGAVLAFQKMVEEEYSDIVKLQKVYAGAGIYDLEASFDQYLETDFTGYPCSIPYSILGLNYGDNLGLDLTQLFKEPLLSNYEEWYHSKNYNSSEINRFLGNDTRISSYLQDNMFDKNNPEVKKLSESFKKNSLIDWTPQTELLLFHSTDDTYVHYANSESAYNTFLSKGCDVELVTTTGDHAESIIPFYFTLIRELLAL